MVNIEVLASTMNLIEHKKLIKNMNIKKSVIINQTQKIKLSNIEKGKHRLYSYQEKGLSKSRNRAIEKSNADICVIADDDIKYEDNYIEIIKSGYEKYKDADIIAFHVDNVNPINAKRRPKRKEGKINFIKSMKIQSVQLTFRRKSIIDKKIKFNENFGTGTDLYMGEENIFLSECLKKKLKIYYIPETIATIQDNNSSWFKGYNEYCFNVKGAVYYEISNILYPLLILQFAFRKRKFYLKEVSTLNAIKYMFEGVKKYKESIKKKIYYMGDFVSNTGPAIVNKNYYPYMKNKAYICKTNSKFIRPLHFLINIFKCDVLLISGMSKFHIKSAKFCKSFNKKVIYLMHGYSKIECELNEIPEYKRNLKCEEEMLQIADKIICVSEIFCEYMKNERSDIKKKIAFVNNGIEKYDMDNKKKIKSNTYIITTVGGGYPRKNGLSICKAISKLNDIKIKFIVIGPKDKYGEEIKKYDFVEYYEKLNHNQVIEKMKESDLYIQNSLFETFGLAVCEAISSGCKILISSKVGALSIIENIDDDMIIKEPKNIEEISDKIRKMYNRQQEKIDYIVNWEEHSWENSSKLLLKNVWEDK